MNILIIGAGGREYSIALVLKKDKNVEKLYFSPGNGATDALGENLTISDFDELADFVEANNIDLTIVGPEAPLVDGIVDVFEKRGLTIFGPTSQAAQLVLWVQKLPILFSQTHLQFRQQAVLPVQQ